MAEVTKKQLRIIDHALDRLFSCKSLMVPESKEDFSGKNVLMRLLRLADSRTILLTDAGLTHMRAIVATFDEADAFGGLANYSDIWTAFKRAFEDYLSKGMRPDNAAELLELMRERFNLAISTHTYAVPVFGVDMVGIDVLTLGSMKIVRSPVPYLEGAGVKCGYADLSGTMETTKRYLWLLGYAKGTRQVAQEKFREQAELAVGMLAVCAASMYERGASGFRIGVVMTSEVGHGRAVWLSWNDRNLELTTHRKFSRSQWFKVDSDLVAKFTSSGLFDRAFEIFQSNNRTQLEEAITRGVYWFSDAHRDPALVMRLIKYWSCIETFFSAESKDVTRSVSVGLASVLVYGGYRFIPETEYITLKKRVAKLYNARSRAVHGGAYHHVSQSNVDVLSRWAAWMLINMVSFVQRGYTRVGQIKVVADRLDRELGENMGTVLSP